MQIVPWNSFEFWRFLQKGKPDWCKRRSVYIDATDVTTRTNRA